MEDVETEMSIEDPVTQNKMYHYIVLNDQSLSMDSYPTVSLS